MEQIKNGVLGSRKPILDAAAKVTGQFKYVDDMKVPQMLYGKILHSTVPHARIISIDTSEAENMPGVEAVVTYKDSPDVRFNANGEDIDVLPSELVLDQVVRYVGDKVAAVAAETPQIAAAALKTIKVEYEELPFVLDPEEALKEGAYPIHEGGNALWPVDKSCGDPEKGFAEADFIVEGRYTVPAIHHGQIEPHVSICSYDCDGKLTVWTPTQDVFGQRNNLSRIFGLPYSKIRVINPGIGGAFGSKIDLLTEPVGCLLSMKTGRPVKITYDRREDITSGVTRHAETMYIKSGVKKDGTITACEYTAYVAAGSNSGATMSAVWAPSGKFFTLFKIPNMRFRAFSAYTNTLNGTAMRGFGSPQLFYTMNAHFNEIADKLGMDLTELEYKNMNEPNIIDGLGDAIGNMRGKDCVALGKERFGYEEALKEQEESKQANGRYRIGVGFAAAPHGCSMFGVLPDTAGVMIKMNEDGSITMFTGVSDMGNGSNTTQMLTISETLGIPTSHIAIVRTDTETTMYDVGIYASRGTYVGSGAALKAAKAARELILREACELLELPKEDLELRDNGVYSESDPEKHVSMREVAAHAHEKERDIAVAETYGTKAAPISAGAHFVKVQVDTETGEVTPLKYCAIHDVGTPLNFMNLEGQTHGGIQMGLGYALSEGLKLNERGEVTNKLLRQQNMFKADQMPRDIHVEFLDSYEESGPYGAKSIGECATVPSAPAVANAVSNALGIHFHSLPISKEKILEALGK